MAKDKEFIQEIKRPQGFIYSGNLTKEVWIMDVKTHKILEKRYTP